LAVAVRDEISNIQQGMSKDEETAIRSVKKYAFLCTWTLDIPCWTLDILGLWGCGVAGLRGCGVVGLRGFPLNRQTTQPLNHGQNRMS
jgi:hypothetical protein